MNMAYCRFENTLYDLQDCYDNMYIDYETASAEEKRAFDRLIKLCCDIANKYGEE